MCAETKVNYDHDDNCNKLHYFRVPTLLDEKNSRGFPGVCQSDFRIFQVLSVIVRNRISNTFGLQ